MSAEFQSKQVVCDMDLAIQIINKCFTYLLFFQVWIISGSVIPFSAACLSSISNKNLIARGTSPLDKENIETNRSLTKCCRVPLVVNSRVR